MTGFKWIGDQIAQLEAAGEVDRFIFGFEESYGYLGGSYVRDKDAVIGSMLICEMAAYYRSIGVSLLEAREAMYKKYGNYVHTVSSFTCEGAAGMEEMARIMGELHANAPADIAGFKVVAIDDYLTSESVDIVTGAKKAITLPKSDVLCYTLENKATVIIRPSGTEPKIKAYYTTVAAEREEAVALGDKISAAFKASLGF